MRHPAAPTLIAVLLGIMAFFVLWGKVSGGEYHEGNPHPDDVPPPMREEGEEDAEEEDS
ncbi:hypothetical protein BU23DRAFT_477126 [Bimuria novae-zelandiae CBS 107.79]|uniref:Secreted protein n=1 Tax=Bimuria novae-zelandiae CBS 107.79 TaxID=1447943 RepID=A0A6A5UXJ7_9PLEO|nr:hypothetical protein BU23DRAFT_477126 [Bimuria novae-zelandiae CBS 107.79]